MFLISLKHSVNIQLCDNDIIKVKGFMRNKVSGVLYKVQI